MTYALVQSNTGGGTAATSKTIAFTGSVTAGNLLAVAITTASTNQISSVTDSLGNTYTVGYPFTNNRTNIYYCISGFSGSNTVTVNFTTSTISDLFVREYSGIAASSTLNATDGGNSVGGGGTSVGPFSITTTVNNCLIVTIYHNVSGTSVTASAGTGYANVAQVNNFSGQNSFIEDGELITAGSTTPKFTVSPTTPSQSGYQTVVAFVEVQPTTGTIAVSQGANTTSISGTEKFTGTLADTQSTNTTAIAGSEKFSATLANTQGANTAALAGTQSFNVTGSIATTQGGNTTSISGVEAFTGTLADTQGANTTAISGQEKFTGTLANTQSANTTNINGVGGFFGSLTATQGANATALSGQEKFLATATVTQASNTIAITEAESFAGTLAVSQAKNAIAITDVEGFVGNLITAQGANTTAIAIKEVFAVASAVTQQLNSFSATDIEGFTGQLALSQGRNTISNQGLEIFRATIGLVQSSNIINLSARVAVTKAYANLSEELVTTTIVNSLGML